MAKSARASTRKRNNAALRTKIFGPAHDARTERLSAKLQELISKPKPVEERVMEADGMDEEAKEQGSKNDLKIVDEMDLDAQMTIPKAKHNHRKSKIEKKKVHKKARNSIIFPSITRKRKGPGVLTGKR